LEEIRLSAMAQETLDGIVRAGVQALFEKGEKAEAARVETEYQEKGFASWFATESRLGDLGLRDIGDHKPLSKWLAGVYDTLEKKVGGTVIHQGLLGDIWSMNYAIPVVFHPRDGDWRTHVLDPDRIEYRKHFIPFANIVTYYTALLACQRVAVQQGLPKEVCQKAATELREVMGRNIAPKISDYIFLRANGQSVAWSVTADDLVYQSADQLEQAIGGDL
jgi:hypothetical protein